MCLKPKFVPNPYYSRSAYCQEHGDLKKINSDLYCHDEYIQVACGECAECRYARINNIFQRALVESLNSYVYFVTLTYDNKHIPSIVLNHKKVLYADYEHIQLMMKRFRDSHVLDRDFSYLCVNEYGSRKNRPHFHLLIFVSKRKNDEVNIPYIIQDILFKNIGRFFAVNIGTRKNPKYEQLFTYKTKIENGKVYSNYFVKYVDIQDNRDVMTQKIDNVRSIYYLIGYINKTSRYEEGINIIIDSFKERDEILYFKLKGMLKSQIRYSKNFGCGFDNGKHLKLDRISVRCSTNLHVYTEVVNSLPDTYEEFKELYPSYDMELMEWRARDYYQHFSSWKRALNGMSADEYLLHCTYLKYFLGEFSERYLRFKKNLQPTISSIFSQVTNYRYNPSVLNTHKPTENITFKYLRQMVDESISKALPIISFRVDCNQCYIPMCRYYRERVCVIDDTYNLYKKLGVKNYNEWLDLFEKEMSNRRLIEQRANEYKFYNYDILEEDEDIYIKDLYKTLFQ